MYFKPVSSLLVNISFVAIFMFLFNVMLILLSQSLYLFYLLFILLSILGNQWCPADSISNMQFSRTCKGYSPFIIPYHTGYHWWLNQNNRAINTGCRDTDNRKFHHDLYRHWWWLQNMWRGSTRPACYLGWVQLKITMQLLGARPLYGDLC